MFLSLWASFETNLEAEKMWGVPLDNPLARKKMEVETNLHQFQRWILLPLSGLTAQGASKWIVYKRILLSNLCQLLTILLKSMFSDRIQASTFIIFSALIMESIWGKINELWNGSQIGVKRIFQEDTLFISWAFLSLGEEGLRKNPKKEVTMWSLPPSNIWKSNCDKAIRQKDSILAIRCETLAMSITSREVICSWLWKNWHPLFLR